MVTQLPVKELIVGSNPTRGAMNEDEFKKKLNPERYRIMRQGSMETAFSGRYWDTEKDGTYHCAACGNPLFRSKDKFDAGTGWPSFRRPLSTVSLEYKQDANPAGEIEMRCKKCHSHIGRLIGGASGHYRANSIALDLEEHDRAAMLEGVKDNLETAKDAYDEQNESREQHADKTSSLSNAFGWLSGFSQFFGGSAVGAVVGATAALLFCHSAATVVQSNVQVSTSTAATTSPPRVPVAPASQGTTVVPPATTTRPQITPATTTIPTGVSTSTSTSTLGSPAATATSTQL